jgi:hypothetical protein
MPDPNPIDSGPAAGSFEGRAAFEAALLAAFQYCARQRTLQVTCADTDFAAWPLGRTDVLQALGDWVGGTRRLTLIAAHYNVFPQRHTRWVNWRRTWSHAVQCLAVHEELATQVPTLLLTDEVALRLHDPRRHRGAIYRDAADLARCRDLLDALTQRTEEAFPVTTLGL